MLLSMRIELAAGGVIGRDHVRARKNGQDAVMTISTPDVSVIVVADGCSSCCSSEVGAQLGARFIATSAARGMSPNEIGTALVTKLGELAHSLSLPSHGLPEAEIVADYFL